MDPSNYFDEDTRVTSSKTYPATETVPESELITTVKGSRHYAWIRTEPYAPMLIHSNVDADTHHANVTTLDTMLSKIYGTYRPGI